MKDFEIQYGQSKPEGLDTLKAFEKDPKYGQPVTIKDLRGALKLILRKEIDNMPKLLEQLTPKERLDFISRLMPFIFPKPDTISPTQGEPVSWDL